MKQWLTGIVTFISAAACFAHDDASGLQHPVHHIEQADYAVILMVLAVALFGRKIIKIKKGRKQQSR